MRRIDQWHRLHRIQPPVALRVVASPIGGDWLVRTDGWRLPEHFKVVYPSLEAAQRAADDMLINYEPHDCRQGAAGRGCRSRRSPRVARAPGVTALPDKAVLRPARVMNLLIC